MSDGEEAPSPFPLYGPPVPFTEAELQAERMRLSALPPSANLGGVRSLAECHSQGPLLHIVAAAQLRAEQLSLPLSLRLPHNVAAAGLPSLSSSSSSGPVRPVPSLPAGCLNFTVRPVPSLPAGCQDVFETLSTRPVPPPLPSRAERNVAAARRPSLSSSSSSGPVRPVPVPPPLPSRDDVLPPSYDTCMPLPPSYDTCMPPSYDTLRDRMSTFQPPTSLSNIDELVTAWDAHAAAPAHAGEMMPGAIALAGVLFRKKDEQPLQRRVDRQPRLEEQLEGGAAAAAAAGAAAAAVAAADGQQQQQLAGVLFRKKDEQPLQPRLEEQLEGDAAAAAAADGQQQQQPQQEQVLLEGGDAAAAAAAADGQLQQQPQQEQVLLEEQGAADGQQQQQPQQEQVLLEEQGGDAAAADGQQQQQPQQEQVGSRRCGPRCCSLL